MPTVEFERLFATLVPGRTGKTAVTLTDLPGNVSALLRIFDKAIVAGNGRSAPLAAIDAPLSLYPNLGDTFWHVPIADSSDASVVRLTFESRGDEAHHARTSQPR